MAANENDFFKNKVGPRKKYIIYSFGEVCIFLGY